MERENGLVIKEIYVFFVKYDMSVICYELFAKTGKLKKMHGGRAAHACDGFRQRKEKKKKMNENLNICNRYG